MADASQRMATSSHDSGCRITGTMTATKVVRSLVLMRLKNWDYRELRERIADGLTLRQFTDFYGRRGAEA